MSIPRYLILSSLAGFTLFAAFGKAAQELKAQSSFEESFSRIQKWWSEEEYARAESDLREILGNLLLQLGGAMVDSGKEGTAESAYREAVRAAVTSDRALVTLVRFYLLTEKYDQGLEAVQLLLEINPIHPLGLHLLGKLQILNGEPEAASHALRDAYLAAPEQVDIGFSLGYSYLRRKDFENAGITFGEIIARSPNPVNALIRISRAYLECDLPEEGIPFLQRALATQPGNSEARSWMGHLLLAAGRPDEAGGYLEGPVQPTATRSVLLDDVLLVPVPTEVKQSVSSLRRTIAFCYGKLGELQFQALEYGRAVDHVNSAIEWDPDIPGIHLLKASGYLQQNRILDAVTPALEAFRRQPANLEVQQFMTRLAIQLTEGKHLETALQCTEKLLEVLPESAFLYVLRGRIQAEAGSPESALQDFGAALRLSPDVPEAHYNSGVLQLTSGELESALQEFDLELALNPGHEQAVFKKAQVLVRLGRPDEALPLFQRSVQLEPRLVDAYRQMAQIQLQKEQWILAIANLETASQLAPEQAEILLELSKAYRLAGREFDAERTLERYRTLQQ